MGELDRSALTRMRRGALVLAVACIVGVGGYRIAGWSFLDAIYMVVITIFGVGFGEARPLSQPELKIFTILLVIVGCSALIYILGGFFQLIAEGELKRALGKLRMTKEIKQLRGHVIICGYGRIGRILAGHLNQAGVAVVIVDNDAERCEKAAESGYLPLQGDASHDATLQEAGIEKARALCTVLPNDAMNVFITLTARNLNRELSIIARGEYPETEPKLIQAGASRVVLPSATSAIHMADIITRPAALDYLKESELSALDLDLQKLGLQMLTLSLDETAEGRTVRDLEKEAQVSLMVVALLRTTGEKQESPALDEPLHPGDRVVLIAHSEHAHEISLKFSGGRRLSYRGASVRRV